MSSVFQRLAENIGLVQMCILGILPCKQRMGIASADFCSKQIHEIGPSSFQNPTTHRLSYTWCLLKLIQLLLSDLQWFGIGQRKWVEGDLNQLIYLTLCRQSPYFVNIFVRGRQSEAIQQCSQGSHPCTVKVQRLSLFKVRILATVLAKVAWSFWDVCSLKERQCSDTVRWAFHLRALLVSRISADWRDISQWSHGWYLLWFLFLDSAPSAALGCLGWGGGEDCLHRCVGTLASCPPSPPDQKNKYCKILWTNQKSDQ